MDNRTIKNWTLGLSILTSSFFTQLNAHPINDPQRLARFELEEFYSFHCHRPSDIHEHLPTLRKYAKECSTVVELGVRNVVSTWGLVLGLAESSAQERSYIGIDIDVPTPKIFKLVSELAPENGVSFQYLLANDMDIEICETDLLFIDTLHIYAQLRYELEKFCPQVRKYIIMHDTTSYDYSNCLSYQGDYSEYPTDISRTKRGLWPAIEDFLESHPEWRILKRYSNNNGLTVLVRNQ
jgi:hypothetical protein